MSLGRAERHGRDLVLCGLLIAVVCVFAPTRSPAKARKAAPSKQDEACLACHGTAGMKSDKGKSIYVDPAKHAASAHAILGCSDCHTAIKDFPHPAKIAKVQCATCHADEVKAYAGSVHAILGDAACATCHGSVHELTAAAALLPGKCSECHADEVKSLAESIHGQAAKRSDPDSPNCESCHGSIHEVKAASEPDSTV